MSQKTNLNVSPYYDDFDPNSNYYRVLFKPGFPVQSRELSVLQSILQNQIKSFGNHIFKDGSIVIPGNISYNSSYYAVKINPTHVGLSVGLYLSNTFYNLELRQRPHDKNHYHGPLSQTQIQLILYQ